ncbi:hypothetical protein [Sphingobium sp. CFD-1]|uniref:hypothetical protein n=1 Tax=Sphingobium sp. CFD-1 TaxID=2878545 RepID=UPI00214B1D88|nr:hypothetical protein [Sphingobium sp. CFD-1]
MTKEEAAAALDGCEYGEEGSKDLFAQMKADGLVAVFGASDDLMEFRGAIDDEVGCYGGGTAYLTRAGLLNRICDNDDCPHERDREKVAPRIEAIWCDTEAYSWTYKTDIPHVAFDVVEGADRYCRGIVFALSDVPA